MFFLLDLASVSNKLSISLYILVHSCLNVKEVEGTAQSRREIGSLSDCNWTRTHNHLVRLGTEWF